jgi:D-glycero-alpha-D-manno-heptose-7-phosphate kinase
MNLKNNEKVVISKTPLRISFLGGGTDMPYFYKKNGGITVSCAINKFIYVMVKRHSHSTQKFRLNYSITENVNSIEQIKNLRIKETLKLLKINFPLYINTISDLPANSGLGSSSSFTIGLVNALNSLLGRKMSVAELAETGFEIEKKIVGENIGKQDHYAAAFGGFNKINYKKNNQISINPINLSENKKKKIEQSLLMIWTGQTRSASKVLSAQKKNFKSNLVNLNEIKKIAYIFDKEVRKSKLNISQLGELVDKSWTLKKTFASSISNNLVDKIYKTAKSLGAYGGKLLGAGSGGFLVFFVNKKLQNRIIKRLNKYSNVKFEIENHGSKTIFISE